MIISSSDNKANNSVTPTYDFWILWIAANGTGIGIGTIAFYIVAMFSGLFGSPSLPGQQSNLAFPWESIVSDIKVFVPFGGLIGIMQWFVLRKHVTNSGMWFLTTAFAMFLGGAVSDVLPFYFRSASIAVELFLLWFLFGSVSGIGQWMILQKQVNYAGWWILINMLAGSIAGIFFPSYLGLVGGCIGWAFSGIITGGTMFFLLQHRKRLDTNPNVA